MIPQKQAGPLISPVAAVICEGSAYSLLRLSSAGFQRFKQSDCALNILRPLSAINALAFDDERTLVTDFRKFREETIDSYRAFSKRLLFS